MYWTEKDEELVIQWQARKTKLDELNLYNRLNTKIYYMCETIFFRYYKQNTYSYLYLIQETRNHVFVQLDTFKHGRGSAYSYISAIIKFYYNNFFNVNVNKLTDFDYEIKEDDLIYVDEDNNDNETKLINYLNDKIEYNKSLLFKEFNKTPKKRIELGYLIKEYFEKYGLNNFRYEAVLDYLKANSNYTEFQISGAMKYFLKNISTKGLGCFPDLDYTPIEKKWIDKIGLLNTDLCPIIPKNTYYYKNVLKNKNNFYPSPF